jgi:uncharacterized protein
MTTDHRPEEPRDAPRELQTDLSPVALGVLGLIGGFVLYHFFGGALIVTLLGVDYETAGADALLLTQAASQTLFILLPAIFAARYAYHNPSVALRVALPDWTETGLLAVGLLALVPALHGYLSLQEIAFERLAEGHATIREVKAVFDEIDFAVMETMSKLLGGESVVDRALIVLAVAFVPAVCEEALFRGFIQRTFEIKWKKPVAALVTAIFFGLYHFNPYALVPLVALGWYLGYAAYRTGSILVPMALHFINNMISIVLFFIFGEEEVFLGTSEQAASGGEILPPTVAFLLVFFIVVWIIQRRGESQP